MPTANHQVFDSKEVKAKSTVVVTLKANAANVRLLDTSGYSAFCETLGAHGPDGRGPGPLARMTPSVD